MTQDTDPTRLIAQLTQTVPVPRPSWLLSVYAKDVLTRLPEGPGHLCLWLHPKD